MEESFENMSDDLSELAFELSSHMQNFFDDYFNDEYEVLRFNINFLESNGFTYQTNIDYMKLNRFISAAFNTIQTNDIQVIDTLISKFYKDIIFLNAFYKDFLEKSKDAGSIFRHYFLKEKGGMEGLYHLVNKHKPDERGMLPSLPNKAEMEAFEERVKEEFRSAFTKEWESYSDELRRIINTKTYYFDKLLWSEARKSSAIKEFFRRAKRSESDISHELSIKIFIEQYMQTIDVSQAKDVRWHQYLENVLKIMD